MKKLLLIIMIVTLSHPIHAEDRQDWLDAAAIGLGIYMIHEYTKPTPRPNYYYYDERPHYYPNPRRYRHHPRKNRAHRQHRKGRYYGNRHQGRHYDRRHRGDRHYRDGRHR